MPHWPRRRARIKAPTSNGVSKEAPCILAPLFSPKVAMAMTVMKRRTLSAMTRKLLSLKRIFEWYLQGWSIEKIKKELEASRISNPRGKRRRAVRTITDILFNEKNAGDSVYGQTVAAEYPDTKRVRNSSDEIFGSENHHPPILDKASFDQVQEMRKMRSNIELDEQGNKVRKNTHYSMKRTLLI